MGYNATIHQQNQVAKSVTLPRTSKKAYRETSFISHYTMFTKQLLTVIILLMPTALAGKVNRMYGIILTKEELRVKTNCLLAGSCKGQISITRQEAREILDNIEMWVTTRQLIGCYLETMSVERLVGHLEQVADGVEPDGMDY